VADTQKNNVARRLEITSAVRFDADTFSRHVASSAACELLAPSPIILQNNAQRGLRDDV
jgi:hypothetical protein